MSLTQKSIDDLLVRLVEVHVLLEEFGQVIVDLHVHAVSLAPFLVVM